MRLLATIALLTAGACASFADVPVIMRYRSPKNRDRPVRRTTELIILHTTEAPAKGSLRHLSDRGECNYCITEDGTVYSIVDRERAAFHSGQSMWNGKEDVDNFSVGIECVGYHDKPMPMKQLRSVRALVKELQARYSIPDHHVLSHSQVAYGSPNKWQKKKHRGRKRCGMLFVMPSVRRVLQLKTRPALDPDVKAKRLAVGDAYLEKVLYGNVDTMRGTYGAATIRKVDPSKPVRPHTPLSILPPKPAPPRPAPPKAAKPKAPAAKHAPPKNIAGLKAQGYAPKGKVTKSRLPSRIVGSKWNAPDTFYTIRSKVVPGNKIDQARVEEGMVIWRKD